MGEIQTPTKKQTIITAIIILLFSNIVIFIENFDLDASWHLNIALNIANGNLPYKDFNMITTPLFYYLISIPVLLIQNSAGYYIMQSLLVFFTIMAFYYIFTLFIKPTNIKYLLLLICTFFTKITPDYNILLYGIGLFIVYFVYKYTITKNNKYLIIFGISSGLTILTKQTSSFIISGLIGLYVLYFLFKEKQLIKLIYIFIPIITIVTLFIGILYKLGNLNSFIDFCFLGISNFKRGNMMPFSRFIESDVRIKTILVLITIVILNLICAIKIKHKLLTLFELLAFGNLMITYPLPNLFHMYLAIIGFIVPIIWIILFLFNKYNVNLSYIENIKPICLGFFVILIIMLFCTNFTNISLINEGYMKNVFIRNEINDYIKDINNYQECHKENNYYSPEDIYVMSELYKGNFVSGYLSQFNRGNIGSKAYEDVIKQYENNDNNYFYIFTDEDDRIINQVPAEALDYIKTHYKKIDSTKYFDIYKVI